MNCFQLIKEMLDEAYAQIPGTEDEKLAAIQGELTRLRDKYSDLRTYQNLDYSDPKTRFAYVYKYVTSHAYLVYERISQSLVLRPLFELDQLHVTCIGGGPGSDLVGILRYLHSRTTKMRLSCEIFDRETAWGESWQGLLEKVECEVRLFPSFNQFDVTAESTWKKFNRYLSSDLFTMVYFMSEVYGIKEQAEPYFLNLFAKAKPGAAFLFIDNNKEEFFGWFDDLAVRSGLKIQKMGNGKAIIPPSEEKNDLGEYFVKLKESPKIQTFIAWRIAVKE